MPHSNVGQQHPGYVRCLPDWISCQDAYAGERRVKGKGEIYLSPTAGMVAFGQGLDKDQIGAKMYEAYKMRAVFPSIMEDAVEALLGIMHRKPPDIQLPARMEPMRDNATPEGESLELLLRKINEQQLVNGRIGLLLDLPKNTPGITLPYIASYHAPAIINWDDGESNDPVPQNLNLVVLDESEQVRREEYDWEKEEKYRVLFLGDLQENEAVGVYQQIMINLATRVDEVIVPEILGQFLNEIPFVFINAGDLVPEPTKPPLLGLSDLAFAIYRGEADFRQALFMQGQDTLVVEGGEEGKTYLTGAGATITPPIGGTAKYIGVQSTGLQEMRKQLENDKKIAAHKAAQMTDTTSRQRESGEALRVRVAAQTATLNQQADTGAEGLQSILRIAAEWLGEDPKKVIVKPNKDFSSDMPDGTTMKAFVEARVMGLPWSKRSMHEMLKRGGMTKMTFEDELSLIAEEDADDLARGGVATDADTE